MFSQENICSLRGLVNARISCNLFKMNLHVVPPSQAISEAHPHPITLQVQQSLIYALFFQDGRSRGLSRRISPDRRRHGVIVVGGGPAATRAHATRTHAASASPSSPNGGGQCRRRRQFNRQSGAKDFKYITGHPVCIFC